MFEQNLEHLEGLTLQLYPNAALPQFAGTRVNVELSETFTCAELSGATPHLPRSRNRFPQYLRFCAAILSERAYQIKHLAGYRQKRKKRRLAGD